MTAGRKPVMPGVIRGVQRPRQQGYYVIFPAGTQFQGRHNFSTKKEAAAFVERARRLGVEPEVKA